MWPVQPPKRLVNNPRIVGTGEQPPRPDARTALPFRAYRRVSVYCSRNLTDSSSKSDVRLRGGRQNNCASLGRYTLGTLTHFFPSVQYPRTGPSDKLSPRLKLLTVLTAMRILLDRKS